MAALDDSYDFWDKARKLGFHDELLRMHMAIRAEFEREAEARHTAMLAAETPQQREQRIATAQRTADNWSAMSRTLKEFYSETP